MLVLAVAADLALGDPANRWHPVAWIGTFLAGGRRWLERGLPGALLVGGAALLAMSVALAAGAGWGVEVVARSVGWPGVILEAIALKMAISLRDLARAGRLICSALDLGDVAEARRLVGYHLVSRPTATLDPRQVASAAVESMAENVTDAVVAPLLWYLAFGLAAAYAYRAVNTADAMIGYRDGALEYFGKASARLDDLLNFVPARLAALAIVGSALVAGEDGGGAWRVLLRDRARTASPNAGWTMAAMAGALGVALEKPGAYRLGSGRDPESRDIIRAIGVSMTAALSMVLAAVAALILRSYWG